jgi:hypothetical protein
MCVNDEDVCHGISTRVDFTLASEAIVHTPDFDAKQFKQATQNVPFLILSFVSFFYCLYNKPPGVSLFTISSRSTTSRLLIDHIRASRCTRREGSSVLALCALLYLQAVDLSLQALHFVGTVSR